MITRLTGAQRDRIAGTLETIGLQDHLRLRAGLLSHGQKQWLELGMLLIQEPRLLLVDEPVAGMTQQETERTAELLTSLAGQHTVVVVEHDMEFTSLGANGDGVARRECPGRGSMEAVQNNARVREVYLGT